MIDLIPCLDEPHIRQLLSYAIGFPTPDKLNEVCNDYKTDPNHVLLGYEQDSLVMGCIGIDLAGVREFVITHIAVLPNKRRLGIARFMIEYVIKEYCPLRLIAETDKDTIDFYHKCGFEIKSLGEKYHGTERFICERNLASHEHRNHSGAGGS